MITSTGARSGCERGLKWTCLVEILFGWCRDNHCLNDMREVLRLFPGNQCAVTDGFDHSNSERECPSRVERISRLRVISEAHEQCHGMRWSTNVGLVVDGNTDYEIIVNGSNSHYSDPWRSNSFIVSDRIGPRSTDVPSVSIRCTGSISRDNLS